MSPVARLGDLRGRALWVIFGSLVCQLGLGLGYVMAPLLKDITAELGLSRAVFSTGSSLRLLVMSLASPLLGLWVVRRGARPVLVLATLLVLPTFFLLSRMQDLWQLYAANAVLALVMTGFGDITLGHVVANWVVRGRGLALGLVFTGSNLAGAALVPLVSWLGSRGVSWREALLMVGVGATVVILPFAAGVVRERRPGDPEPAVDASGGPHSRAGERDLTVGQALRTRSFWILGVALSGFFFYMLAVLAHFHASLTDSGLTRTEAGQWFSIAVGLGLVSKVLMGFVADRLPARPAIIVDYALFTVSSILLLFVPAAPFLQLFVLVFGFAYAARDVVYPLAIAECFGVKHLAPIYGALMVVLWPAGSLGEIFAGFCFDRFGSYDVAFQTFALVNLAVLGLLFLLRDERVGDAER